MNQHDFPKFFRQDRIEINIIHPEKNALKQQSDQCLQFAHVPFQGDYSNILSVQNTADNQLNAKPVVKQRHTGDEFPV